MEESDVLIKLRRKYTNDEVIAELYKRLSEKNIEIGQLKSEVEHLNSELGKQNSEIEKLAVQRIKEHPMWVQQKKLVKDRGEQVAKLKLKNLELSRENYSLKNK